MSELFDIRHGDSREVLKSLAEASVDAVVTDPPYELGFMGKGWDATGVANDPALWGEVLRVLKPGGHLLAFSGTRTYHRMVCAIEDAGFEVRDQIQWVYSSGFPKSHNLDNMRGEQTCGCESTPEHNLRPVREGDIPKAGSDASERRKVLQPRLSQPSAHSAVLWAEPEEGVADGAQSCLEGRGDDVQEEGQLRPCAVRTSAAVGAANGPKGRVSDGAPAGDGRLVRVSADADGSGAPPEPRSDAEPAGESGTVAGQQEPQTSGAWPVCGGCGKPILPKGLGTALKPSNEPICMARKPLIGTVLTNVLAYGTGALNIDGCRIEGVVEGPGTTPPSSVEGQRGSMAGPMDRTEYDGSKGRWPANLVHDGSDEVLAAFPDTSSGEGAIKRASSTDGHGNAGAAYGAESRPAGTLMVSYGDEGSAARFFYCAKATQEDRNEGAKNTHPTVKPTDLMRWLVRLVTPKGGLVLDPFMGSGSTGKAAMLEGMRFLGIDMTAEYVDIARARIDFARRQGHQPSFF